MFQVTWTASVAGEAAQLKYGEDHLISYLPLSHVAAQLVDIYAPIMYGASVYFAQPDALKVGGAGIRTDGRSETNIPPNNFVVRGV